MSNPSMPSPSVTALEDPSCPEPELSQDFRLFESSLGQHLFVVDGSRIFDLDAATAKYFWVLLNDPKEGTTSKAVEVRSVFSMASGKPAIAPTPLSPPPLRSLSLNVAQSCNLGCKYCYADEGGFLGKAQFMAQDVAEQAVDRLIAEAEPNVDLVVGFMGGEPLLNRQLVHHIAGYARRRGEESHHKVRFSITTNGTLITPEDAALFSEYRFNVSLSLDGPQDVNDRSRPTPNGRGSYAEVIKGLKHLQAQPPAHTSARITVTPQTGRLLPVLEHVLSLGVDDAGFAPVLVSPNPEYAFQASDFVQFLEHMIECGEVCKQHLLQGKRFPFTNFETALNEIHRGSHRPYPCGAGAGYLSVNAQGKLYGCHRLVDDSNWEMGSIQQGSDYSARAQHLQRSHVDSMEPCRTCWARYLCGGGCYHEVNKRGRIACDYIRGWLDFCLASYAELSTQKPEYFLDPETYFVTSPEMIRQ
ncbi:radical SAM protein [Moorena sp. SIO4G3]|uniref:radical SAM/SPASM domain-containing protein n=1 Tax=Moorena sp. SIO4G3 TaxID=2607821 RepID=UPI001429F958|nr:radical SAM protein [Moorena sp. SIO4G3]NEO77209.1 radical SAM protein [Moorena sp. SIO4G3]